MFKVGDKIKAIDNKYKTSKMKNETEGVVVKVRNNGNIDFRVTHSTIANEVGKLKENMKVEHFGMLKDIDKLGDIDKYIINENATIIYWKDGDKTIVKRKADDSFNKQLAFLTAYFQKKSGLTKHKANIFLDELETKFQLKD